jgi:TonB-linked SusC/RagA family outer membrane protein
MVRTAECLLRSETASSQYLESTNNNWEVTPIQSEFEARWLWNATPTPRDHGTTTGSVLRNKGKMNMKHRLRALWGVAASVALAVLVASPLVAQDTGTIEGTVIGAQGQPLAGVQVSVVGSQRGALTAADGSYRIAGIQAGPREIRVQRVGYRTETQEVIVPAAATVAANFTLQQAVIDLGEVVVTGVAGETARAKLPFEVARVDADAIPVPARSAGSAIQGKVAGATVVQGSGRPGSAPSILLRGPTSIDASGRSQEPLYVVDGVILNASMVDIDALDIESVEVVKGAAAASLFGSRAANGVVQIQTRRGTRVADDQVRYSLRSEMGFSELASTPDALLSQSHRFRLTDDGTAFWGVNAAGEEIGFQWLDRDTSATVGGQPCVGTQCPYLQPRLAGTDAWDTYQANPWPRGAHDQVEAFFETGRFSENRISAEGRSGATNFLVSFSRLDDGGIFRGFQGLQRNNFRLNVDQSVRSDVQVSASAFYSRGTTDQFPETNGNPLFRLTRQPAGVNLFACEGDVTQSCLDDPSQLQLVTDPTNASESENPVYELYNRRYTVDRGRFLGSGNLRYDPMPWLSLDGNVSYDRFDYGEQDLYPKGFRTVTASPLFNEGFLDRWLELREAINASATATVRFDLSDGIRNRTQLRYLFEDQDRTVTYTRGHQFRVDGIEEFVNVNPTTTRATSLTEPVRSDGYFAITNFDIFDRYIVDALIRNDGSSLFGPDQRRHWYYRVAGAWRLSQEPWFTVPTFDELKLRYSLGTAGNRPRFEAQYETFSLAGGSVIPVALGNRDLRPEHSVEHEVGVDAVAFGGRIGLGVTYANTVTSDQILQLPLPRYTGYSHRWENAGTLASNTWEASLDAQLVQTPSVSWSARLLWDRTRSTITALNVPAFRFGVPGQNLGEVFYAREGEQYGTFYGIQFATECGHLPAGVQDRCGEFVRNDDGFLVWVGETGASEPRWGDDAPLELSTSAPHLAAMKWGTPFAALCEDRTTGQQGTFCPLGKALPDYTVSLASTVGWRGLTLYGLIDAVQGFDIYNQPLQWAVFRRTAGTYDQADVPEADRKPLGYYDATYQVSGLRPSSEFVEDGSFIKLRELALRYGFTGSQLAHVPLLNVMSGAGVTLTGRNLFTWTDYRGFDPEVGKSTGDVGSAALGRVEGYQYPNFRTWTLGVELNF